MVSGQLDWMVLEVFSKSGDSMSLHMCMFSFSLNNNCQKE